MNFKSVELHFFDVLKKWIGTPNLFQLLFFLILFPLLALSFFNNPASDDFDFSARTRQMGFLASQIWRFHNEGGRYFANGILSLNPLVFEHYFLFKIIPIFSILFFIFSIRFLLRVLLSNQTKSVQWTLTFAVFALYLIQIPSVSSAFFWTTGAITYQLSVSLTLFFYGFLMLFIRKKSLLNFVCAAISLILLVGCNEIILIIITVQLVFLTFKNRRSKLGLYLFILFLLSFCFGAILILAPGNAVRSVQIVVKHQFFHSVFKTIQFAMQFLFSWIPLILLFFVFLIPTVNSIISDKNKHYFKNPYLVFLILFGYLCFTIFPGFWTLNSIFPHRVLNVIYFFFVLGFSYNLCCFLFYLQDRYNAVFEFNNSSRLITGVLLFFFTFSSNSIYQSYHDFFVGKAYKYNLELKNRFAQIEKSTSKRVFLQGLKNKPSTIYDEEIMGLTTDVNNWKNKEFELYYSKEVLIIPTDSIFTE